MSNKSTKLHTKFHQTDRNKNLTKGVLLSICLIATPFLFYIYTFAPTEAIWKTFLGTIDSGMFYNVQNYLHAIFTKFIFILLTGIWFFTSQNWWKYAILVPFTMFLFQFLGVINFKLKYYDEFDFWYSIPIILPILTFIIYISIRVGKKEDPSEDLKGDLDDEIKRMFHNEL